MGTDIRVSGRPSLSKWRAKVPISASQSRKSRRFLTLIARIAAAINVQTARSLAQFPDRPAIFPARRVGKAFAAALPRLLRPHGSSDKSQSGKTLPPRQVVAFAASTARLPYALP